MCLRDRVRSAWGTRLGSSQGFARVGVYVRKSLKAGPFRFNLSKSGVGVSAGVPGFRVGTGPRGNYVNVGAHGVYYRTSLGHSSRPAPSRRTARRASHWPAEAAVTQQVAMRDTTGATAFELVPTSADDLVSQLNDAAVAKAWWPVLLLIPVLGWTIAIWLRLKQHARKSVVVFYEVEDSSGQWFEQLLETWGLLGNAAGLWRMTSQGSIRNPYQQKVNAGAGVLINRARAVVSVQGPPELVTNIAVPSVRVGQDSLHFLPDRVLVRTGRRFSEVSYSQLSVHCVQTRYIESERVPRDAVRVGTTWQYANVGGGPDRRFKNNRQLPILGYMELRLSTPSGLQWTLQCSNQRASNAAKAILASAKAPRLTDGPASPPASQLLSDGERDRACEQLRAAYLDGRLTESEYEERSGAALKARRQSELDACLEGIPAATVRPPTGVTPRRPAPAAHAPQPSPPIAKPPAPPRANPDRVSARERRLLKYPVFLLCAVLPFGFGFWTPLYAGLRTRHKTAFSLGLVATAAFAGGCVALDAAGSRTTGTAVAVGSVLWLLSWAITIAGSWIAWNDHKHRRTGPHRWRLRRAESPSPAAVAQVVIGPHEEA